MEVIPFLTAFSNDNGAPKHSVIKVFFFIFLPLSLLITLLFYGMIAMDNKFQLVTLKERELGQAEVAAHLLEYENHHAVSELLILSHSPTIRNYFKTNNTEGKKRITTYLTNLIFEKQSYDHILFMDDKGNEVIRVDRVNGKPVVKQSLKNVANQDFFINTMKLDKNQIYISPLTIMPNFSEHIPIVHFGIPIFDENNVKKGALIYSLSGQKLLSNFNIAMRGNHTSVLINQEGKWINHENMHNDINNEQNFKKSYPLAWDIILRSDRGTFETKKGLFAFTTLYPLLSSKLMPDSSSMIEFKTDLNIDPKKYFWKIVSFIPESALPQFSLIRHPTILTFYFISLSVLSILAAYFANALTQRIKISRALKLYAAEVNDLYENAPVGYHSLDSKGRYIRVNSTELKWVGYTRDEVVGKMYMTDLLTPTGLRIFNEQFRRFKDRGFMHDLELELIRKDGSHFTIILNATAIYDENNNYLMSRSIMVDISRRKQIEYALKESEDRFRNAMDHAPIGMAIISNEGKFIRVNETLAKVLGYEQQELKQINLQDISLQEDTYLTEQQLEELRIGKISHFKSEKRLFCKNGQAIWVQLTCSAVHGNHQTPIYFIAQIEDISERKVYQESVHHLAYHDTLTTLPNRRLFLDELDKAIHQSKISNSRLAVMYVDIDYFKSINDTLGHDIGDELLKVIATRLKDEVRDSDVVARTGGDEFVILLSKINSYKDAELIANSIINSLRVPIQLRETKLKITVSIGISIFPQDAHNAKALMKNADKAMYAAKNAGKDQYLSYVDCKEKPEVEKS